MKNTKRRFIAYSFYDRTGIEAYLEKQAQKGWLLDKVSSAGWHFHRITPQKLHFSVVYFVKASAFDPEPSLDELSFQDFCEHTGWHLAASNAQMQIFYNEAANPTPIETDAELEVSSIHASAKKSYLPSLYLLTATGILQMCLYIFRLVVDPVRILTSNTELFTGLCWLSMLTISVTDLATYYRWLKRAKTAAQTDGSFVETNAHPRIKLAIIFLILTAFFYIIFTNSSPAFALIMVATFISIIGLTAILLGISHWMKKLKLPTSTNRTITMTLTICTAFGLAGLLVLGIVIIGTSLFPEKTPVATYEYNGWTHHIYHDNLPLKAEDLFETDYDNYSYEIDREDQSILAGYLEASQRPCIDALDQPRLDYKVVTIKAPLLYDRWKNAMLDNFADNEGYPEIEGVIWEEPIAIDAAPWNAVEAYQLRQGNEMDSSFLLCYETHIVEIDIDYDGELTDTHKNIIGDKLGDK